MHQKENLTALETYFSQFRENVIGINESIQTPYGKKKLIYADWTASGRLYRPIEEKMARDFGPFVANTHTETSTTGTLMTLAYHEARHLIKKHVNAGPDDVIVCSGAGMTAMVNKFQRILGLKIPEQLFEKCKLEPEDRPIVFVSHMEHHSNHTSWLETICDVEVIPPDGEGMFSKENFEELLDKYKDRKRKYLAITACSNVTGIKPCCRDVAKLIHQAGGYVFVDYACSAPYVDIEMHTDDPEESFDAIFFSPHKFLGGPGSAGVLIFNKSLYKNRVPDNPGGGTVTWTNAWGERHYFNDIEVREDGGTPSFLQTIRVALAIRLKEQMGTKNIMEREEEIKKIVFDRLLKVPNLHFLAEHIQDRLGVFSFYIIGLHYNLGVKLLNDRFGIQTRGGCSCAGTYGHYLLEVSYEKSHNITSKIDLGDFSEKPGWIRMSIHPVMTNEEIEFICNAIEELAYNYEEWGTDYIYDIHSNEYVHKTFGNSYEEKVVKSWFLDDL